MSVLQTSYLPPNSTNVLTLISLEEFLKDQWNIIVDLELKGRGIKLTGDGSNHKRGIKSYKVTEKAREKRQRRGAAKILA